MSSDFLYVEIVFNDNIAITIISYIIYNLDFVFLSLLRWRTDKKIIK